MISGLQIGRFIDDLLGSAALEADGLRGPVVEGDHDVPEIRAFFRDILDSGSAERQSARNAGRFGVVPIVIESACPSQLVLPS
jgi:hypothetical protein